MLELIGWSRRGYIPGTGPWLLHSAAYVLIWLIGLVFVTLVAGAIASQIPQVPWLFPLGYVAATAWLYLQGRKQLRAGGNLRLLITENEVEYLAGPAHSLMRRAESRAGVTLGLGTTLCCVSTRRRRGDVWEVCLRSGPQGLFVLRLNVRIYLRCIENEANALAHELSLRIVRAIERCCSAGPLSGGGDYCPRFPNVPGRLSSSTMHQRREPPILLDGAMGSLLDERGVDTTLPLWSAQAVLDAPNEVLQIHCDYLRAGAEVLTTNTFRTHRRSLAKAGLGSQSAGLTRHAARLALHAARESREGDGRSLAVAGSISPLEDCYRPDLAPAYEEALPEHREMARDLALAGVDLLLIETMPAWPEAQAALSAALETGLPVWLSLHTQEPGVLLSGEPLGELLAHLKAWPDAVLVNCIPAERAEAEVRALRAIVPAEIPIGVYANSGHIDPVKGWSTEDRIDPERYAELATRWVDAGATIIGGCCGTTPAHIAALATTLGHANRLRP